METITLTRFFSGSISSTTPVKLAQWAVHDLHMVAHIVSDHDLMLFHAHGQNLLLREGDGFVGGAHEAR